MAAKPTAPRNNESAVARTARNDDASLRPALSRLLLGIAPTQSPVYILIGTSSGNVASANGVIDVPFLRNLKEKARYHPARPLFGETNVAILSVPVYCALAVRDSLSVGQPKPGFRSEDAGLPEPSSRIERLESVEIPRPPTPSRKVGPDLVWTQHPRRVQLIPPSVFVGFGREAMRRPAPRPGYRSRSGDTLAKRRVRSPRTKYGRRYPDRHAIASRPKSDGRESANRANVELNLVWLGPT
jgi:hypothetical protein